MSLDAWPISLDIPEDEMGRLAATLSADEAAHASSFRFRRDSRRFIAGRDISEASSGISSGRARERLASRMARPASRRSKATPTSPSTSPTPRGWGSS